MAKTKTKKKLEVIYPRYKFPPIPNDGRFIEINRSAKGFLYAEDIDFLAVCEYESTDGTIYEQLCFIQYDNAGFFDIQNPERTQQHMGHVEFVRSWVDTHNGEPVYKWDLNKCDYYHPIAGLASACRRQPLPAAGGDNAL